MHYIGLDLHYIGLLSQHDNKDNLTILLSYDILTLEV